MTIPNDSNSIILSSIGGIPLKSPGLATFRKPGTPRGWDVQKGGGQSGAFVIYTGEGLAKFDVDISLWLELHFLDWQIFARTHLMRPIAFTPAKKLGIYHPRLQLPPLNITDVVIEDVTGFEQDDDGMETCTISFLEYRAPKPIITKPLPAIPATSKAPPTAGDALELKLQASITALSAATSTGGGF